MKLKYLLFPLVFLFSSACTDYSKNPETDEFKEYSKPKSYFIGDTVAFEMEDIELKSTVTISEPLVVFKEGKIVVKASKEDIITRLNTLLSDADSLKDQQFYNRLITARDYINTNQKNVFSFFWSMSEQDGVVWGEADGKEEEYFITKRILQDPICDLIDVGKFQLIIGGQEQTKYFNNFVDSRHGSCKGIFSSSGKLVWICYPCANP